MDSPFKSKATSLPLHHDADKDGQSPNVQNVRPAWSFVFTSIKEDSALTSESAKQHMKYREVAPCTPGVHRSSQTGYRRMAVDAVGQFMAYCTLLVQ
jgi:hypothetical protein